MKKIMKKALSLMIALVMMFSLAPMTASAADDGTADYATGLWEIQGTLSVAANSTCYYEIGMPDDGVYQFTVTGNAGFEVSTCTEAGGIWSITESTTTEDTDGEVESTITAASESWGLYAGFVVKNNTDSEQVYEYKILLPEGTQGNPAKVTLAVDGTAQVTVPAYGQYYVAIVTPEMGKEYKLTITGESGFSYGMRPMTQDVNGKIETSVMSYSPSGHQNVISNNTDSEQTYTLALANMPLGAEANPDRFTAGTTVTTTLDGNQYWYSWVSTETGVLKFTVDETASANGWFINAVNDWTYETKQMSDAWGDPATFELDIEVGDTIKVGVSVPGDNGYEISPYVFGTGTVVFSTTVEEKVAGDDGNGDGDGTGDGSGEGTGTVTGEEINSNYFYDYTELGVGTVMVFPNTDYATTLYTFRAEEAGTYTITLSDTTGAVGYYGSNEWFPYDYTQDTGVANTYTYTLNYTQANAPALIGISGTAMTDITITKAGEATEDEGYEKNDWPLTVSPEAYTFDGDEDKLVQFIYEIADGKVMYVMDDNGYFHVAPVEDIVDDEEALFGYSYKGDKDIEELPYVLVDLSDKVVSLQAALAERTFLVAEYDEEGNVIGIIDFTPALKEYLACADKETGLYPLTFDLYTVFTVGGEAQGWYMSTESATGIVAAEYPEKDGVDPVFLHTFAMYYLNQDVVTLDKEEPVVDKDTMADIIANNQAGKDTVINTTTKNEAGEEVTIKFEFAAGTMKPVDGKTEYTFEVSLVEKIDDATAEKAEIKKDTFVLGVSFEYDGKLPAKATITIPVPAAYANKTLYYYEVLADGTLKYVCDAPVDANGNAKVTQDHCSDYVLLTEKIVEEAPKAEAPDTSDATNLALWIAVLGLGVVAMAGSVVMKKREF